MYSPRPLSDKDLGCHICGKPAKWYDREFHSKYVLGEALCDDCERKWQMPMVSFPVDIKHPQVIAFAKAMDEVLTKNDHKGGWQEDNCTIEYLQHRLVEEMGEYFRSLEMDVLSSWRKKELVDVANFAMMLWDRS